MDNLKISVVTVCYNAAATIEETIQSVLGQTYPNVEYIIIDGGSTDGTVDIIKRYADRLAYWVSEPDNGIYDAMNKGIAVATGDYINFMNAGDKFYDNDVIRQVFLTPYPASCNVIYGKTLMNFRWGTYIVTPTKLKKLEKYMCLCHQSVFVKVSFHKANLFDTSFQIMADYQLLHSIYTNTPDSFVYFPGIIANYDAVAGLSANESNIKLNESKKISHNKTKTFRFIVKSAIPYAAQDILHRILWTFKRNVRRVNKIS